MEVECGDAGILFHPVLQHGMERQSAGISVYTAVALVIASMVGTGVFTSLGFQIKDTPAGFPILVLWMLGGIVSLCGAFCYAELAAMMPRSGGEYHLLSASLHPMAGFMAGWVSITAGFAAPAASAAMVFGRYMQDIWPGLHSLEFAIALVLIVVTVQLFSLRFIERFQVSFTVMKVLLIMVFLIGAMWLGNKRWDLLLPAQDDFQYFVERPYAIALVFVMYAYTGWNGAVYVVGDIRNPQKNLPRALVFGTLGVMVLYLALNAAFMVAAPWAQMEGQMQVALIAARAIFGDFGGNAMGGLIALGLVAHVSAMIFAGTRVLRVIGQDVWFMHWLDRSNKAGAPWLAVLFLFSLVMCLLLTGTFDQLLLYIQGLLLLSSLLCVFAVMWLRWKRPNAERPFKVPLYPLPPLIFMGMAGWMLWALMEERPKETTWGALTLLVGVVLYLLAKIKAPRRPVESHKQA